jgi:hypothetical protein
MPYLLKPRKGYSGPSHVVATKTEAKAMIRSIQKQAAPYGGVKYSISRTSLSERDVSRNPRAASSIPGLDKWSMFAGGTAAAPGKHGYDLRAGGQTYTIQPISSQHGRHLGYRLTAYPGIPARGHQQIGGLHRSPQSAVKAAREWAARQQNPRTRKTRDEWQMWSNYGYGWEHELSEDTFKEIKQRVKEYRENAPQYSYKIKLARVRVENPRASVARIPSTWTPARVTRLKTGQIQLRIGRRAGR